MGCQSLRTVNKMTSDVRALSSEPMRYFSHDSDAASDIKCQRLILRHGFEGYGRWWRLCEFMAGTKGHTIPFQTDEDAVIIAQMLGFEGDGALDACKAYMGDLLEIGLLENDGDGTLRNRRMERNSVYFGRQRANGRKGGKSKKRGAASTGGETE